MVGVEDTRESLDEGPIATRVRYETSIALRHGQEPSSS
jgi:hypothetical protein